MQISENDIKAFVIDSGIVSRKDLARAEEEAERLGQSIGDILVGQGLLSQDALRRVHAYALGVPFVTLRNKKFDLSTLSLIPEPVARARGVVAFARTDDSIEVALLEAKNLPIIDTLKKRTGLRVLARLTDEASLKYALLEYHRLLARAFGSQIADDARRVNLIVPEESANVSVLARAAEDKSIVRIVDTLLQHATVQGATDVHIEQHSDTVLVRYRIEGVLHDAMTIPVAAGPGIIARIKLLSGLILEEHEAPQDGRFAMDTEGVVTSFRVSVVPTHSGEKAVLRVLRENGEGFTLEALGFHGKGLDYIHKALVQPSGLILVGGQGGSGRTATLYTLLDILNAPHKSIATIEDPIERRMARVNQTQVHPAAGISFASGVRALLRQDPDVLMVGDIRDTQTAIAAVNASLSGRLVVASVLADSAAGAIQRLIDLGVEPLLLASTLKVAIGQRLARRLSSPKETLVLEGEARENIADKAAFENALEALRDEKLVKKNTTLDTLVFHAPKPFARTNDGYEGKVGVFEVLPVSAPIRELLIHGAAPDTIEEQAKKEGMLTFLEDGIYKAAVGQTSIEEAVRASTRA